MKSGSNSIRLHVTVVTLLALLSVLAGSLFIYGGNTKAASVQASFTSHQINLKPTYKLLTTLNNRPRGKVLFDCQKPGNSYQCYGPDQIRQAYGVQTLANKGINGKGASITIIDAYGSPTLQQDFDTFNTTWGLPSAKLNIIAPFGVGGSDFGWAIETTLDVQWAHVMAPKATINLIVARTNDDVDIYNATKYAIDQNIGDVISQSFGENESCVDPNLLKEEHKLFQQAARKRISVFASSGDDGSAQLDCQGQKLVLAASSPASDPLVTAVGATQLNADLTSGKYSSETAWNESATFGAATGGGYSVLYKRPAYQAGVVDRKQGRGLPDVSLNGSIDYGVLVFITDPTTSKLVVYTVGGTSVSSPEFAGLVANGVQITGHRLGFLNKAIYRIGTSPLYKVAFHDITTGSNVLANTNIPGYQTAKGWDAVTGWGTPKAPAFLATLIGFVQFADATGL